MADPVVRVGPWNVDGVDLLGEETLTCSECGDLGEAGTPYRDSLCRMAAAHAERVHDGLVTREGWV